MRRGKRVLALVLTVLLTAGLTAAAEASFDYAPAEATIPVGGTGSFRLIAAGTEDSAVLEEIKIEGNGSFKQSFDEPGDYEFEIFSPDALNAARYAALVSVVADEKDALSATVVVREKESGRKVPAALYPVTVDPPIAKRLTGEKATKDETFVFVFKGLSTTAEGLDGKPPMPAGSTGLTKKVTIVGAGESEAGEIVFDRAGVYEYEFTEEKGTADGYTYDLSVYKVRFTVTETETGFAVEEQMTKDGVKTAEFRAVFTNEYKTPEIPKTGDESQPLLWTGLAAGSAALAFAIFFLLKKRGKKNEKNDNKTEK